jgi:hypothetical protein
LSLPPEVGGEGAVGLLRKSSVELRRMGYHGRREDLAELEKMLRCWAS